MFRDHYAYFEFGKKSYVNYAKLNPVIIFHECEDDECKHNGTANNWEIKGEINRK
jgi:hypothetical protein